MPSKKALRLPMVTCTQGSLARLACRSHPCRMVLGFVQRPIRICDKNYYAVTDNLELLVLLSKLLYACMRFMICFIILASLPVEVDDVALLPLDVEDVDALFLAFSS